MNNLSTSGTIYKLTYFSMNTNLKLFKSNDKI